LILELAEAMKAVYGTDTVQPEAEREAEAKPKRSRKRGKVAVRSLGWCQDIEVEQGDLANLNSCRRWLICCTALHPLIRIPLLNHTIQAISDLDFLLKCDRMQYCHAQALQKATVHPYRGFLRLKKEGASHELVPLFILPII